MSNLFTYVDISTFSSIFHSLKGSPLVELKHTVIDRYFPLILYQVCLTILLLIQRQLFAVQVITLFPKFRICSRSTLQFHLIWWYICWRICQMCLQTFYCWCTLSNHSAEWVKFTLRLLNLRNFAESCFKPSFNHTHFFQNNSMGSSSGNKLTLCPPNPALPSPLYRFSETVLQRTSRERMLSKILF